MLVSQWLTMCTFRPGTASGPSSLNFFNHWHSPAPPLASSKWNFAKFLVDKNGKVVSRYESDTSPSSIEADIAKLF